jgi:prepilin-type N-terminal cleavage/methylation domain-containing protein/prepilin-type processing-associated H-X9-DG protein
MHRNSCSRLRGFTLVELLVVIAIIGILVALLLPAIQAAREAARRSQCKDHLKNLALGCLLHEDAQGFLPTGGWRYNYSADPLRGYGEDQPGSWLYSVLPYIEEQDVRNLGDGQSYTSTLYEDMIVQLHQSPITIFHCPSRRAVKLYPHAWGAPTDMWEQKFLITKLNASGAGVAKTDYAANSGDAEVSAGSPIGSGDQMWPATESQSSYAYVKSNPQWTKTGCNLTVTAFGAKRPKFCQSGVMYYRSQVKTSQIPDGTSQTYLVGEKLMSPEYYESAAAIRPAYGDNQSAYSGYEWDMHRVAWYPSGVIAADIYQPRPDSIGLPDNAYLFAFGSAHPGSMNMAMCDGSVQSISYEIDPDNHRYLANRLDGETGDLNQ